MKKLVLAVLILSGLCLQLRSQNAVEERFWQNQRSNQMILDGNLLQNPLFDNQTTEVVRFYVPSDIGTTQQFAGTQFIADQYLALEGRNFGTLRCVDASSTQPEFTTFQAQRFGDNQHGYDSVIFTMYNADLNELFSFTFRTDTLQRANDVRILTEYSRTIFNTNANDREFIIFVHHFVGAGGPENRRQSFFVVNERGEVLHVFEGISAIAVHRGSGVVRRVLTAQWDNRMHVLTPEDTTTFVLHNVTASFSGLPVIVENRRHRIGAKNLVGFEAPLFVFHTINGVAHYSIPHYRYPYPFGPPAQGQFTPNNVGIVELFNFSTGQPFRRFELPMLNWSPAMQVSLLSFPDFDITSGIFTEGDTLSLLYGLRHYSIPCDCHENTFHVVTEHGEVIRSTTETVIGSGGGVRRMQDIPGHDPMYAMLKSQGRGIIAFAMFNPRTWEYGARFDAIHNGERLSLSFERIAEGDDYVFLFHMSESITEGGNVIERINIYDKNAEFLRDIRFNIGPRGVFFNPVLTPATLNPFLFNADAKREFVGFARSRVSLTSNEVYTSVFIFNEEGDLLYRADDGQGGLGTLSSPFGIWSMDGGRTFSYFNLSHRFGNEQPTTLFYRLPFDIFSEGDGSLANPYIIREAGQLDAIRHNPRAHYKLGNDIDMSEILSIKYSNGWVPIPPFTGSLDGQNFAIQNMRIENVDGNWVGLFSAIGIAAATGRGGGLVQNLRFEDTEVVTRAGNTMIGVLAGMVEWTSTIRNVHVTGSIEITANLSQTTNDLGGIVGRMVGENTTNPGPRIEQSSFEGTIFTSGTAQANGGVGGIAGNLRQNASVVNSFSRGTINVANAANPMNTSGVGGIVGWLFNTASIENTYSTMDITAGNFAGGILGRFNENSQNKGTVINSYATGRIVSTSTIANTFAGGVVGWSSPNNAHFTPGTGLTKTRLTMSGLVALNDTVTAVVPRRVIGTNADRNREMASFGIETMDSIRNVFAIESLVLISNNNEYTIATEEIHAGRLHGATVTAANLTQEFFTNIGWRFGTDAENPWFWVDGQHPRLWFELVPQFIALNSYDQTLRVDSTFLLTATIYPEQALNKNVTWTSANSDIATVVDGLVTAIAVGTTTITVTSEEGNATASAIITVLPSTFTITAFVQGGNGTITPSGMLTVAHSTDQTFTFTPNAGFDIYTVLINGENNVEAVYYGSYTFVDIQANHMITVAFTESTVFTVTITPPTNGTITVMDGTTEVATGDRIDVGTVLTLTAVPNEGYQFVQWWDGTTNAQHSYTLSGDLTISATFVADETSIVITRDGKMFSVYPNPTSDVVHIETDQTIRQVTVFDQMGRAVKVLHGNLRTVDLQSLPAGNYILQIMTETAVIPIRIVKQ